jgi:hypothetical protein
MGDLLTVMRKHASLVKPLLAAPRPKYFFINDEFFRKLISENKLGKANQIYTAELLAHLHIAALVTLKRQIKWIHAIEKAIHDDNYFAFCVSLRGFIEFAADSFFSLKFAPSTLTKHFSIFKRCLDEKETARVCICEELETMAIHFLQAGKHDDKTKKEEYFKAKKSIEYIESIDDGDTSKPIYTLYQQLCQISHPARQSAWMFLKQNQDLTWSIQDSDDRHLIKSEWIDANQSTYDVLFQKSFNASFLTLYFLDKLAPDYLPCLPIRAFNFSPVDGFKEMQARIGK